MKTITAFTKLTELQQIALLKFNGKIIDAYADENEMVLIYFLNGFFAEYIMKEDDSVEIIPCLRGYKLPAGFDNVYHNNQPEYYRLTA